MKCSVLSGILGYKNDMKQSKKAQNIVWTLIKANVLTLSINCNHSKYKTLIKGKQAKGIRELTVLSFKLFANLKLF